MGASGDVGWLGYRKLSCGWKVEEFFTGHRWVWPVAC